MLASSHVIGPLRALLVLLFVGLVVAQALSVPGQFTQFADGEPGLLPLKWPLLAFTIVEILALQVVLVCIWRLLGFVRSGRIFSEQSFVWVDAIMWTMVAAWALLAAVFAGLVGVIFFTPELRDPGLPMLLFGITTVGGVIVLLMVVMRSLLRQATAIRDDLETVI